MFGRGHYRGHAPYRSNGRGGVHPVFPKNRDNKRFNPKIYKQNQKIQRNIAKTTFVNDETEQLRKELETLMKEKESIEIASREKRKEEEKTKQAEIMIVNGERYILKGNTIDKVIPKNGNTSNVICLHYCKSGECTNPKCRNKHDKNLVRLCPSFLKGCCHNEKCKLNHTMNKDLLPLCYFYLNGRCTDDHCNYRHCEMDPSTPICGDFNHGYCSAGASCPLKHLYTAGDSKPSTEKNEDMTSFLPSFVTIAE